MDHPASLLDQRLHEVADQRPPSGTLHLQGADPLDRVAAGMASARRAEPARRGLLARYWPRRGRSLPPDPVDRAARGVRARGALRPWLRSCRIGRRGLPISRGLRSVGERDGDPLLDRDRGAVRRSGWSPARDRGVPIGANRARARPAAGSHADGADLRLSGADPLPVRVRSGGRDDRDHHLRDPADGQSDDARAAPGAGRDRGVRAHGRLLAPAASVEGAGAFGTAVADGRHQSGDHALAQHGDHRVDDRGGRPRLRCADFAQTPADRRRRRSRCCHHPARHRARIGSRRRSRVARLRCTAIRPRPSCIAIRS